MKKLLLLFLSLLTLLPAWAETQTVTVYDYTVANTYKTTSGAAYPNLFIKFGTGTVFTTFTPYNTTLGSSTNGYIRYMSCRTLSTDEITVTSDGSFWYTKNGAKKGNPTFSLSKNVRLTFSAIYGKITQVRVYFDNAGNSAYYKTNATMSHSGDTYTFNRQNDQDIYFYYTSSTIEINKIEVVYESGEMVAPGKPKPQFKTGYGYEYDANTETLLIPTFPKLTSSPNYVIDGVTAEYSTVNYYTFKADAEVPESGLPTTASSPTSGWIQFPATGIPFATNMQTHNISDN